ncbi:hypothetical protein FKM82_019005 [Ascaphus truei]
MGWKIRKKKRNSRKQRNRVSTNPQMQKQRIPRRHHLLNISRREVEQPTGSTVQGTTITPKTDRKSEKPIASQDFQPKGHRLAKGKSTNRGHVECNNNNNSE